MTDARERNLAALDAMVKGDSSGYVSLLTSEDDITWGNPFGPFVRGRKAVETALTNAATRMRGGRATKVETLATYVSQGLAVVVDVEHAESTSGGTEAPVPTTLRVTSVFRLEGEDWRLVHRHADPITTPR